MQVKTIAYFFVVIFFAHYNPLFARYDHVCSESNESVAKFRRATLSDDYHESLKICIADKIIGKHAVLFDWPVDLCDFWVSSLFGPRTHRGVTKMHGGIDLASLKGTLVKAAADGIVTRSETNVAGYGTLIEINHGKGFITRYGHLHEMMVCCGETVRQGEQIGTVGATGNVRGKRDPSHLHFEILLRDQKLNPLKYLYCGEVAFSQK